MREQMSKVSFGVSGQNIKSSPIGYSDIQKFINYTSSILVYEKTVWNVLRRLGHNQKTCIAKTAGFTQPNDQLKQEYMKFISKMKKENRFYLHLSVIHSIDVNYSKTPKTGVTTFSPKQRGQQKADSEMFLYINVIVTMLSDGGINYTRCILFTYGKRAKRRRSW
jgi:hypothetical protein